MKHASATSRAPPIGASAARSASARNGKRCGAREYGGFDGGEEPGRACGTVLGCGGAECWGERTG
jgi:hypothetical protein